VVSGNFSTPLPHYLTMDCDTAREVMSARIDGEDQRLGAPPRSVSALEEHLANCAACREWQRRAHAVTRRVRLGGAFLDHDLSSRVLAAVPAVEPMRRLRLAQRGALVALALAQFAIAAPMLFLGHDHDAGVHAAHELGSFNMALAIAFAVGAIRPRLSAGLAWPSGMAAVGLVITAIADLISGQAVGADEALHLVALAGAAVLVWQDRTIGVGTAGPAIATGEGHDETWQGTVGTDSLARFEGPPGRPWGGDAARVTDPDIAARAVSRQADAVQSPTAAPAANDPSARHIDANDRTLADRRDAAQPGKTGDTHDEAVA
jgi:predicted anti-sigma-YlaC factor YlaD